MKKYQVFANLVFMEAATCNKLPISQYQKSNKKYQALADLVFMEAATCRWWAMQDSNLRPTGYEPVALTN